MAVRRHVVGSSMEWGDDGIRYQETMQVTGVSASNLGEVVYNAMLQVPQRNATLTLGNSPDDVTLFMHTRTARRVVMEEGGSTAMVTVEAGWRQFAATAQDPTAQPQDNGPGVATVGSVVELVTTEFDVNGNEITLQRESGAGSIIQPLAYRRPRPVIEFTRWESSSPQARADSHVGKTNSDLWNGYAVGTVLCTAIVGTTRDEGDSYDVRYEFEVKENGWDGTAVFIDEANGRPVSGLVDGVSTKSVPLYESISFSDLSISL